VKAVVDCANLATTLQAQGLFEEVFTRRTALPVEPATHPALDGELCEFCFDCDKDIFVDEVDSCHFGVAYLNAQLFILAELKPAMHRACATKLAHLVAAEPAAVVATYEAAKELKRLLRQSKLICDGLFNPLQRRYCACSNTNYLHWAPAPHPGECVYSP
jgi:hypothetical protein